MRYIIWLTHGESVQVNDVDLATEGRWMALRHGVVIGSGTACECQQEEESNHDVEHFQRLVDKVTPEERVQLHQTLKNNIAFTEEMLKETEASLGDYINRLTYMNLQYSEKQEDVLPPDDDPDPTVIINEVFENFCMDCARNYYGEQPCGCLSETCPFCGGDNRPDLCDCFEDEY